MSDWKSYVRGDPLTWLLEEDNPSVRYFAQKDLMGLPETDPQVEKSKQGIMERGIVPLILSKQNPDGSWLSPGNFYVKAKYKGTVWQILILAEMAADGKDERIRKAAEYILNNSQVNKCGGFAYQGGDQGGGDRDKIIPCLTANMVWSLIRLGYLGDDRVRKGIEWMVKYQRFDDAVENAPSGWPYDKFEKCWGRHTCSMGVVKVLKALAEIPAGQRNEEVKRTIDTAVDYLMKHQIYRRSHDLSKVAKRDWLEFGFPLLWKTNVLEIAEVLLKLGHKNEIVRDVVDMIISKQNESGQWVLEYTFNGRFWTNIESKGKPSKWITLNAVRVIKGFYD